MRILLIGIALLMSLNIYAQKNFEESKDKENGSIVYKGKLTYRDLEYGFDWFRTGYSEYKPDSAAQAYLQEHLKNYHLVIFMGTWCDDSKKIIPGLYKLFINIFYTGDKYEAYGVDRAKTTLKGEHKTYDLKFVPTIIVLDGNKEIGRIVENVNKSIESDLAAIIKAYKAGK